MLVFKENRAILQLFWCHPVGTVFWLNPSFLAQSLQFFLSLPGSAPVIWMRAITGVL